MKSAALLQLPGNPFALAYWLRNYECVWKGEVDELHVFLNGAYNQEYIRACREMTEAAGAVFLDPVPQRMSHGYAAQVLFNACDAEVIMMVEDDAFVRTPGRVADAVEAARGGFVVGSPRGGMSATLEEACREKWGPNPTGPDGSNGYGLWPCFLFAQREALKDVWYGFPAQEWRAGVTIPGLDMSFSENMHTDTFTASAYALRARDPERLLYEGQWKELWLRNLPEMQERAGYDPPWFHAGGLANEDFFNGGGALDNARPNIGGTNEGRDWAHRLWWIRRIVNSMQPDFLPDLQYAYHHKLDTTTHEMDVLPEIQEWAETEPPWVNWDDQA